MSYLAREASILPDELWAQIDEEVVKVARQVLTGRRFLPLFGPLGVGVDHIAIDEADQLEEVIEDSFIVTKGRKYAEIPTIYADFALLAKSLESAQKAGFPVDLSKARAAAECCALSEDRLIYFGNEKLGYEGLLTVKGANKMPKKDWSVGENAFMDVASALSLLLEKGLYGPYALVVSPDLYVQLQRLQPNTGLLEIERIANLLQGRVYRTPVLCKGKALLVCPDERNMDLVVGQDMATAYLEQRDLNHYFRVLETVLLRIKRPQAIVVFE